MPALGSSVRSIPDSDASTSRAKHWEGPAHCAEADCVAVVVFSDGALPLGAQSIEAASGGAISEWRSRGDISGRAGHTLLLYGLKNVRSPRVCIVGLGLREHFSLAAFERSVASLFRALRSGPVRSLHLDATGVFEKGEHTAAFERIIIAHSRSEVTAARGVARRPASLETLTVAGLPCPVRESSQAVAIGEGQRLARTLVELAPNDCPPRLFVDEVHRLLRIHSDYECEVMDHRACGSRGLHALKALGESGPSGAWLVLVKRRGGPPPARVILGSGLTFDSGGLNFDARREAHAMRIQKAGPAIALGAYSAAMAGGFGHDCALALVVAESVMDGRSLRPGDVLTTLSGQTVELSNTRNVLRLASMDALTYCNRTLRGSTIVHVGGLVDEQGFGLGRFAMPLVTNDESLAAALIEAGVRSGERLWRMPLLDGNESRLESTFADRLSQGGFAAAGLAAARLLSIAARGSQWAHLETGATAWDGQSHGEATGRGVRLLCEWLRESKTLELAS
jgi:leucyl aminopeptidase